MRGQDAINSFREALQIAKEEKVGRKPINLPQAPHSLLT